MFAWDTIKERVADQLLAYYLRHTANLTKDKVLAKFLLSPLGVRELGVFVPYRMPIAGLYQNRRLDGAGWLSHRSAGTQRRDRHSAG